MNALDRESNLIDALVAEQRELTAVERFARSRDTRTPATPRYNALIPLTRPAPGFQYAFEVNLDKCSGCKACVSACHSLNGLEEDETWRDVGTLVGFQRGRAWQQTVTTACHHCAEPGCLAGCPVMAYEKDAETGIVRHLDDQCIGCQYCTMKCPYDVPKYSRRLGIVRKCDMCQGRLAAGEAPACVQACPHEAITIRLVDREDAQSAAADPGARLLPGAFPSHYTKPTTRFVSSRPIPADAAPVHDQTLRLDHPHWPLIVMLTLTQLATGLFLALAVLGWAAPAVFSALSFPVSAGGFVILQAGLLAAVFHLGRPLGAWRFFLGLRTSWMSREILAFGIFAGAAGAAVVAAWVAPAFAGCAAVAALMGLAAVFTSAMIYVDTRRPFWSASATLVRFYGASVSLGTTGLAAVAPEPPLVGVALFVQSVLVTWEMSRFYGALNNPSAAHHRPARIVRERISWWVRARWVLVSVSLTGLAGAPLWLPAGWIALGACLAGVVLERYVFFVAVDAPRMTGGFAS